MTKILQVPLDPRGHKKAADRFFCHFRIRERAADLALLREIIRNFSALPYENISKIIKLNRYFDGPEKIRLPVEVMNDHVTAKLGGTCFSLTFFLESILKQCGFSCFPVMADMLAGQDIHCCLVVNIEKMEYLIDPGYLLGHPLMLSREEPQIFRTPVSGLELRFSKADGRFHLFTFNEEKRIWRYRFLLKPVDHQHFLHHWYRSFFLPGMHGIVMSAVREDQMIFIRKNFMRETSFNDKHNHNITKDYYRVIGGVFGIPEDVVRKARTALEENLIQERHRGIFRPVKKGGQP